MNSRRKGHQYERDIVNKLKKIFPKCKRRLEYQQLDVRGIDLDNTGSFSIQCKRGRRYAPVNTLEEVGGTGIKMLITRADKKRSVACMYLDDLLMILEDIGEAYQEP